MLGACRFSCIAVKPVLTLLDRRLITLPAWPEFKVTLEGAEKEEEEWVRRGGEGRVVTLDLFGFGKVQIYEAAKRLTLVAHPILPG